MKIINTYVNPKKIPYYFFLLLLTLGASLILGFLSFGGMYALFPILPLAFAAFGLSVVYEGEIYLQNIKGAFNKLFKNNYLKNHLAKEYLLENFPKDSDMSDCPQFFIDYKNQLQLLSTFGHKHLDEASQSRKKQVERTLKDMEKWFSLQLFTVKKDQVEKNQSGYTTLLGSWLDDNGKNEWQAKLTNLRFTLHGAKAFSLLAAAFMGLGTTYLIVDAFTVIPFFAAIPFVSWPIIILPMAIIAGAAYGMMTYNALTDLINNKTLCKWHKKLQDDYTNDGLSVRNVFMATITVLLVGLALALTMCTAGTWWTVASNTRPLFEWMKKMPTFVMSIINPVIIAFSALFFNIQNTAQSLEMVDEATRIKENPLKQFKNAIVNGYKNLCDNENLLQRINIPRILLKLTITPLRILLFLGHLISIAVTADRMPGIPQIVAALVAFISEGFEDAHYFVGHNHAHHHDEHLHDEHHHDDHHQCSQPINTKALLKERLGSTHTHNHNLDIPTLCLKVVASPLYLAAALWDFVFSQRNSTKRNSTKRVLTFWEAWSKQIGEETEHEVILEPHAERPSQQWKIEHTVFLIEKYKTKHLKEVTVGCNLAADKMSELNQLQQTVNNGGNLAVEFETAKNKEVFKRHRFPLFFQTDERTTTQLFIEELPGRIIA